ncbi:MAG: hypothetical protein CMD86_00300 [Gammaproteobacteria bacterium]|mgnify:FL=1|nr:hypothetical protein [Gammaproteobacteria bacterium]HAH67358.1 hypothetical protein [Gammaproteobacteria bacterium]|tara:strand:- start:89 stop:478 length:390 start_codon:yes stop_codon:yes gene_type:complete
MNKEEYTFLGLSMPYISIIYSIFLILFGFLVSYLSESSSVTSFIPSMLGLPILILSLLAIQMPNKRRLLMHIVVMIGFVIFLGGLDFLRGISDPFAIYWAGISKLTLLVTGSIFSFLNIKSFIFIRNQD